MLHVLGLHVTSTDGSVLKPKTKPRFHAGNETAVSGRNRTETSVFRFRL